MDDMSRTDQLAPPAKRHDGQHDQEAAELPATDEKLLLAAGHGFPAD